MGICDTPQVINAPSKQPSTDPAAAINAPCQRKIALMSLRRYPIERRNWSELRAHRTLPWRRGGTRTRTARGIARDRDRKRSRGGRSIRVWQKFVVVHFGVARYSGRRSRLNRKPNGIAFERRSARTAAEPIYRLHLSIPFLDGGLHRAGKCDDPYAQAWP